MKISARSADVEFRDVTRRFGNVVAVDSISFTIASGTLVTLLGPSGCGKTTTLRMIAGLEIPSAGTIRIGGRDVTRLPATARDVSMVFQSYALFPHMNVIENVAYGLAVGGGSKAEQWKPVPGRAVRHGSDPRALGASRLTAARAST